MYYYYHLNYVLQCLLFCYVWWLCMAINISVQHNGGLLPDIILLIQGQRVPRTVFFPWRIVQSISKFALKTMTINHFLEHWRTKITDAGEICGASREAQNIKRMRGCILLILLLVAAPSMPSNHRGRRPGNSRSCELRIGYLIEDE